MEFAHYLLVSPAALLIFLGTTKSQVHAFAFLSGILLWHRMFPAPASTNTRRHLPSKVKLLANLMVDPAASKGDHVGENCPACWEGIDEPIRVFCGHRFRKNCILLWLNGIYSAAKSCLVCKRLLFNAGNTFLNPRIHQHPRAQAPNLCSNHNHYDHNAQSCTLSVDPPWLEKEPHAPDGMHLRRRDVALAVS